MALLQMRDLSDFRFWVLDYLVARLTEVDPLFLQRNGMDSDVVVDIMNQGTTAFAGSYIVIKLLGVPYA